MSDFGVTINGFVIKDADTIREEKIESFKNSYGQDIDVSASSIIGQLIELQTQGEYNLWEVAQAEYSSKDIDAAEGVSLDILCALNNIYRLPAVKSSASVICYGDYNTEIAEESIVRQSSTKTEFVIQTTDTINENLCYSILLEITEDDVSTEIKITMNDVSVTFTGTGATKDDIVNDFVSDINTDVTDMGDYLLNEIIIAENIGSELFIKQINYNSEYLMNVEITNNATFKSAGNVFSVIAIEYGPIVIEENSINEIVTNISGWESVINYESGITGREAETDNELRSRYKQFINFIGNATEDAIASKLILLEEVQGAIVISNRSDEYSESGMPPHSFEAIVITNTTYDPPESIDEETRDIIAQRIWDTMPAGIKTYSRNVPEIIGYATDIDGNVHEIKFSLPVQIPIYITMKYTVDSEKANPLNNVETRKVQIKNAIANYGNANYKLNEDVYATKLYRPVYDIREIGAITSLKIGKIEGGQLTFISILENEVARFDVDRITITQGN